MTQEFANVRYTNWRGETSDRRLILADVRFGSTEWHPEPTWLITAFDLDHPAQVWKEFDLTKCDFTRAAQPPTLAEALALPEVRALVEAAILDAQLRAFEQRRLDTPDEIKAAANARIAAAQEGDG